MATDLELLERWRGGEQGAGNELFERHFSSICRFFENKIQGDVEELVQATFLACAQNRDQFREQSSFRTYLFSIARYQLYGYFRSRQRGQALDFGVTSLVDLGTSPGSKIARNQEHELLLNALCSLPLDQQLLLELFYWEGMESAALAQVFEVAEATVRTRLHRARQVLRERMAELAENPGAAHASVADLDAWARGLRDKLPGHDD
jgi:RNA polymerase sigma-70 factor (ECF subfamily)